MFKKLLAAFILILPLCTLNAEAKEGEKFLNFKRDDLVRQQLDTLEAHSYAQQLLAEPTEPVWKLSMTDCLRIVLDKNINIRVSYLGLDTAKRDVTSNQADFDTNLTSSTSFARGRTAAELDESPSLSDSVSTSGGLERKLPTGGTIGADLTHSRSGRSEHSYSSSSTLSLSQPILSGFGSKVTLASIRISENSYKIAFEDLRQSIHDEITNAELAYWDILEARENLETRKLAYTQAQSLKDRNQRAMMLGDRAYTDVLQAEATAASREEDVIQAENAVLEAEDNLRKILNIEDIRQWNSRIDTIDKISPDFKAELPDLTWCLEQAFANRPDYKQAVKQLENNKINLMVAGNALLPDVTLDANYALSGAGAQSANSFNKLKSGDFGSWDASLSVSYPWDNRADKATYESSVNALKQQELQLRDLRLTIVKEVRSAVRLIQTAIKRVEVADVAYSLQKKNLEAEEKKYSLGLSTSFEVLSFQEDLANSAVSRIGAVVDYHRSVVRLWSTIGITLQKNGILFDNPNP